MQKKEISGIYLVIILQIIICSIVLATCLILKVPVLTGGIWALFQFVGVFIPGCALSLALKVKVENAIHIIMYSYAFGLIVILIQYFITINVNSKILNYMLFFVIAIIASLYLIKHRNSIKKVYVKKTELLICMVAVVVVYMIDLFVVSFVNAMPNVTGRSGYYIDWMFWVGNNISATKGLPFEDFRLAGKPYAYHFFSSAIVAEINQLTSINIRILSFYFAYLITGIILVTAGYSLFSKFLKKDISRVLAMVLLLFTDGTSITYGRHVYFCPFGFDIGYSFGILAFIILFELYNDEEICAKKLLVSVFVIAVCTGLKGPVALVVLFGYFIVGIRMLIKKRFSVAFAYGASWILSFLFIYQTFLTYIDVETPKSSLFFVGLLDSVVYNKWVKYEYSLLSANIPQGIRSILADVMYIYHANVACMLLTGIAILFVLWCTIKKKLVPFTIYVAIGIVLWGGFLSASTVQEGGSQMYFVTATMPYAVLAGIYVVEEIYEKYICKRALKILYSVTVIVISLPAFLYFWSDVIIPKAYEGYANISGEIYHYSRNVDSVDMAAYEWINTHTGKDDIVVVDSFENEDGYTQDMVVGVFTERHVWNDGMYSVYEDEVAYRKQVVNDFMNGSKEAYGILKENDVKFIIETDRRNDEKLENLELNCAFENESIRIFEL